jgi:hypothetical protein
MRTRAPRRGVGIVAIVVVMLVLATTAQASLPAPTDLAVSASPTNAAPVLHWSPVSGATSYQVYRGGVLVGAPTQTRFTDSMPQTSGTYSYTVTATDGSLTSSPAAVSEVFDNLAPSVITGAPSATLYTSQPPHITWDAVPDNGPAGLRWYNVRRDGVYIGSSTTTSYTDSSKLADGSYTYSVRAEDLARNMAPDFSPGVTVVLDTVAASAPSGLVAADVTLPALPSVSWSASSDAGSGVASYRIFRDGTQVGETTGLTFSDTSVSSAGSYSYTIEAVDRAGNVSPASTPISLTVSQPGTTAHTGVSVETGNDQSTGMKTKWPDAKIISITLHWNQLEPSRGSYNWGNLDASLKDAAARNYKVIVRILCGFNSPSWIYLDPQHPVRHAYIIPTDNGYGLTSGVNVPVPWDPDLLVLYKQMMTAVANHLQGSDGRGSTLASHVLMIPVAMATSFGSEMVENFGQGSWAGTYNGVYNAAWNRNTVNQAAWMKLAPSGSTPAEKLKAMQDADTRAWLSSVDAQESILQPTGVMSSVAYGFAFTSFSTATTVESTEVPKYNQRLMTMFTDLQPKLHSDGTLGPWGSWCPPCDTLMTSAIADGGPVGFQDASGAMNTQAKIEYATNHAIMTYHPRFIETVGSVINTDYSYFFTDANNAQDQLTAIWGG